MDYINKGKSRKPPSESIYLQDQNIRPIYQDVRQQQAKNTRNLTKDVEVMDLNSYAQRKTALGGALGMGLFSSNLEQLVTLVDLDGDWDITQHVKFWLLVLVTMILLAIMGSRGRVTEAKKTSSHRLNTAAMICSLLTTVINIAITSFSVRK